MNKIAIIVLIKALASIREDIVKARADGHIDKGEALDLFTALAIAVIREGLTVGRDKI